MAQFEHKGKASLSSDSLVGVTLGGRYRILAPLGIGGAGHVYRAIQEPLGREVAVKVLRNDIDGVAQREFGNRFLREAATAGKLSHPNIVRVHDFGSDQGLHYVVMELLSGRSLAAAFRDGPIMVDEAARLALGVANALRHAHEAGLVHRDVKPNNIMLVRDDDGVEQPKLMDFGLVKARDVDDSEFQTRVGQYMGTPSYMAPEQAKAEEIDGRADLYALGVVIYRMVTGVLPYDGDNPLALAVQHQVDPFPPMRVRAPEVPIPPAFEAIVEKAMAKLPEDRFETARHMADALDAWLSGTFTTSSFLPPPEPTSSAAPKAGCALAAMGGTSLLIAVAVAIIGLLMGVGGFTAWMASQSSSELDQVQFKDEPAVLIEEPTPEPVVPQEPPPEEIELPTEPPEAQPEEPAEANKPKEPPPTPKEVAPKPKPAQKPPPVSPKPEPEPAKPAPSVKEPAVPGAVHADGVVFAPDVAARALFFVNNATEAEMKKAIYYDKPVEVLLGKRPFSSIAAMANTKGIGAKTMEKVRATGK